MRPPSLRPAADHFRVLLLPASLLLVILVPFASAAVELSGRMPIFEHDSLHPALQKAGQPAPAPVEKPFQPTWRGAVELRRKSSRSRGKEPQQNKEKPPTGDERRQQRQFVANTEHSNQQHLKKSPPAPADGDGDGWTNSAEGEHKIVHLTSRPTQLYYEGHELGASDTVELGSGQVCRVKVPAAEVFYIAYEDGAHSRPNVDLFFHCSQYWAWCCGVDCCQVDPTLLLTGLCVCILILAFVVHYCLRSRIGQRYCIERLFRRRKRVIARANAQRRKRSEGSSQGGEMRRIRTNSLRDKQGGHKKLARATVISASVKEGKRTMATKTKAVPEIIITEPSSTYEPTNSDYEDEEEDDEIYEDD